MLFHYFFTLYLSLAYPVNHFYVFPVLQKISNKKITFQCKIFIVPEEGWFGQPKYSTHIKTFLRCTGFCLYFLHFLKSVTSLSHRNRSKLVKQRWKIWKAEASSVNPSSERIEELWIVVGFNEVFEDHSMLHSLCAEFMFSLAFLAFVKYCNLEPISILELIRSL